MTQRTFTIMRHATATLISDRDHTRPLKPEGLDEASRVGALMTQRAEAPDRILSSTALRCRQTRDALCAGIGREVETEFDDALYNASEHQLLDVLAGQDDAGSLLLLAHNPGVSMLALALCPGRPSQASADHARPEDQPRATEEARALRKQWLRMQGGFAPAAHARFEVLASWPELAPHSTHFLRFEEAPASD
ncbi:MAG: histidine phosphatase family protein [Myxococcota bacterium]